MKSQSEAPLLEAVIKYCGSFPKRFHIPGHGGGRGAPGELLTLTGPGIFAMDVTELPGLDDLNSPTGVIARAQELAADAFGAGKSFFLANGTTLGLQAMVLASGRPGDRLILPRNCHRSIIGGLILAGIEPVFVTPEVVPLFNFAAGVPGETFSRAVAEWPDAGAALCVHPSYYGAFGDTAAASRLTRAAGIPLLADEAHGSHLYFHRDFPPGALCCGCDAAAVSMHKTGGSLTQSSLLHIGRNSLLDADRVFSAISLLQTSSPSYILMASLDAARRQLALRGEELLQGVLASARDLRKKLCAVGGLQVFGPENLNGDGIYSYDPSRVVLRVSGIGLTGYQAASWLAGRHGVYVEMADRNNIVMVLGPGITREECGDLAGAVVDMAGREGKGPLPQAFGEEAIPFSRQAVRLREAWFSASRSVKIDEAPGLVCGEWVAVYPPGIPALFPGEEISLEMVNYLIGARRSGASFQGPADPELNYIKVIDI
ncbi:MAG: aminotransferase class I/II-fold pyridoxal phosphate-dependent enzyme [Desulfocucumaceae bacterium]